MQNKKFSDLLKQSLNRYYNRAIETVQVIEELLKMAKEFNAVANRGEELGLSDDEVAFYDVLETNEASVRDLGDDTLKKIAIELTDSLRKNTTIDWAVRETVRARLRLMVKRKIPARSREKSHRNSFRAGGNPFRIMGLTLASDNRQVKILMSIYNVT